MGRMGVGPFVKYSTFEVVVDVNNRESDPLVYIFLVDVQIFFDTPMPWPVEFDKTGATLAFASPGT